MRYQREQEEERRAEESLKTNEGKKRIRDLLRRDREEEIDLSKSRYFNMRSAQARRRISDKKLESREFINSLAEDSRLPPNWYRTYSRQEKKKYIIKEFISPCRRIMRSVNATRAYLDELPGLTQEEVDERITKFSDITRKDYNEALTKTKRWECEICKEEFTIREALRRHQKESRRWHDGETQTENGTPSDEEQMAKRHERRATSRTADAGISRATAEIEEDGSSIRELIPDGQCHANVQQSVATEEWAQQRDTENDSIETMKGGIPILDFMSNVKKSDAARAQPQEEHER